MYIRKVDPAGDAGDLAAVLPVIQAAHAEFVPGEPLPGAQRVRQWTSEQFQVTSVCYAAFADPGDTQAVGLTMGWHAELNSDFLGNWSFINPDAVGPEISVALMDRLTEHCREHGINRLMVSTPVNADAARYAPQRVGTLSFTGIRAGLDLDDAEHAGRAEFAALAEPGEANADYRVVHWVDTCPDELAEAYCVARAAMSDAPPIADDLANPVHDLERMRGEEASSIKAGVLRLVTAAVAPDGAIGGFSMTAVYPEQPEFAEIWDTGVARDHRGRGLGVRIKAAGTLRLRREHPDVRHLYTFTSETNVHMRAVNRRLGYQDAATWEMYVHDLAAPAGA